MISVIRSLLTGGLASCFGIFCLVEGMAMALEGRGSKVPEETGLLEEELLQGNEELAALNGDEVLAACFGRYTR